jgi:predicted DNA-binding ribbon-helix-helix protein
MSKRTHKDSFDSPRSSQSNLGVSRDRKTLFVDGQRTTINLEHSIRDGLIDICRREEQSLDELCDSIAIRRGQASVTSALRMATLLYFRSMLDESGAARSGPLDRALERLAAGAAASGTGEHRLRA